MFFRNLGELVRDLGVPEKVVVGLGPGSYAGTRIAISAAIGLSMGARPAREQAVSLIGYPSICAMDLDAPDYCVVGDARRRSFFFARISGNAMAEGPLLLNESELRHAIDAVPVPMPVVSAESLVQFERVRVCHPSARILSRLSEEAGREFILPPLQPIYLREPHITQPRVAGGDIAVERKPR